MKIKVLAENTALCDRFGFEHGLSLYIETKKHRLLFDTGASGLFAENAKRLGVDIAAVDTVVLSHGHYDHGGGLKTFLGQNDKAKIYAHKQAFEPHFSDRPDKGKVYIGLDTALLPNERFVFCEGSVEIDDELGLFSEVFEAVPSPSGNSRLFRKGGESFVTDDFSHEQNLIVRQNGQTAVIAGCAHRGIVNIVRQFAADNGQFPDIVIGGFHLHSRGTDENEAPEAIERLANELLKTGSMYYTCHCTGIQPYERLKTLMGGKIDYISAGRELDILGGNR